MSNRADRRKKKKQQPRYEKRFTSEQRINAMCKNGITPKDVDDAYAKGRSDAIYDVSDYCMKDCYAGFILAAHEVFGFGHDRCIRLLRAADERICNSLASEEAIDEVFNTVGVKINFYSPDRITEVLEGD
jgi:hypothetical protein